MSAQEQQAEVLAPTCYDCGRPYGDRHGFSDLIIPNEAWRKISPTGDEGGTLCPSCICGRLYRAGMSNVYGAFMSGPIRSVEEPVMQTFRWAENLREQEERRSVQAIPEAPR